MKSKKWISEIKIVHLGAFHVGDVLIEIVAVGAISGAALSLSLWVGRNIVGRFSKGKPAVLLSVVVGALVTVSAVFVPLLLLQDYFDGRQRNARAQHQNAAKEAFMKDYCAQRRAKNDAPPDCVGW